MWAWPTAAVKNWVRLNLVGANHIYCSNCSLYLKHSMWPWGLSICICGVLRPVVISKFQHPKQLFCWYRLWEENSFNVSLNHRLLKIFKGAVSCSLNGSNSGRVKMLYYNNIIINGNKKQCYSSLYMNFVSTMNSYKKKWAQVFRFGYDIFQMFPKF